MIMAGRHLLMRRLGTLARQLGASESGIAPGVASLVQQVCGVSRSSDIDCSVPKPVGTSNAALFYEYIVDPTRA